jgi:uncharacterized membrane protein YdjX (TVP38/TMEM64 family)
MRGLVLRGLLIMSAAAAATAWALAALGLDLRAFSPDAIRSTVLSYGAWAPLAYFLIFGQPVIPLPGSVMIALAGVVFGKELGALAGLAGAVLRASAAFALARLVGGDAVKRYLTTGWMAKLDRKLDRHALKAVAVIRFVPSVPFDMQNFALGVSRVRFVPYLLGTVVGLIPASVAYAYLGDSLTDLKQMWQVVGAVCLVAGLIAVQRVWARRKPAMVSVKRA